MHLKQQAWREAGGGRHGSVPVEELELYSAALHETDKEITFSAQTVVHLQFSLTNWAPHEAGVVV